MSFFNTSLVGIQRVPPEPWACLIILHGLAEHSGRYQAPIHFLAEAGVAGFAYDQRGHGRSPGPRADIKHFSKFAADFATIRAGVAAQFPHRPVFLWGHSLGSIVALCSALDSHNSLAGVITTGCPLLAVPGWSAPRVVWTAARKVAGVLPTVRIQPGLHAEELSHDPNVQQEYLRDPFVQKSVTIRLLVELGGSCVEMLERVRSIRTPWLAVHGAEDSIAPPEGSKRLIESLGSSDKQLLVQPGLFHEVHNEIAPAAERFRELILHWIRERSSPADR
jgi:alpha-beta hydrolase superfamily lysophospholipase